jgi:nucleoid-associated protein YgaU
VSRIGRALVLPATLAVVVAVLVVAGRGALATPPLGSVDELSGWLDRTDTVTAALAIVRIVALVVTAWLLVASLLGALGRVAGRARIVAAADRALPVPLRRLLTGLAGAGAASVVVLGAGSGTHDRGDAVPVGERLVLLPDDGEGTATMSVLPGDASVTDASPAPPAWPAAPATWTVAPGDSFWSIAEEVLADAWGRPPTDAEIDPYWRVLIAANRDRITSGNPDLIFPGQVFVLPAV